MINSLQGIIFVSTPLVIGILLDEIGIVLILYVMFAVINFLMDRVGKKQHAPNIPLCWVMSNAIILLCTLIIRVSDNIILPWESVVLGFLAVGFSTVGTSRLFHGRQSENIKTKHDLRTAIHGMTEDDAYKYLRDRLPEDLAKSILWLDWHNKDVGYVAFRISNTSESALKNMRQDAYSRLRKINTNIE